MRYLLEAAADAESLSAQIAQALTESPLASRLCLEDHEDALVLELRGATLDEARALLPDGIRLRDAAELRQTLDEALAREDVLAARAALLGLGVVWHSDLRLLEILRRLATHPRTELRAGVIALASRLGYRLFLLELWAGETDPTLWRILRSVTAFPEEPPA